MPTTTQVVEGLWQIKLGPVNAFLLDSGQGDPLDVAADTKVTKDRIHGAYSVALNAGKRLSPRARPVAT